MGRCYPHLNLEERRILAKSIEAKIPMREIAEHLGRARSTLYREVRRNQHIDDELPELNGYHALAAQSSYERRRAVHRKLVRSPQLNAAVVDRLKAGWSPEQIAGRMKFEHHPTCISHETIYRYAYSKEGRAEQFFKHLPEQRRLRRRRGMRRHHGVRFPAHLSIAARPDVISNRNQFGTGNVIWSSSARNLARPTSRHW